MSLHYQALLFSCLLVNLMVMNVALSPLTRQKRSDDVSALDVAVERLSKTVDALNAQLTQQASSFTAQLNSVNAAITALSAKTDKLKETVAFYAWNNAAVQTAPPGILKLNHVATNIGNAYDMLTGTFTAPVSGLYEFQSSFMSHSVGPEKHVYLAMYVDSTLVSLGISDTEHGHWDQTVLKCVVHVNAGQRVYLKNPEKVASAYLDSPTEPYTTFSGSLIKAD